MSDFPAAHSMDTTWFAIDADGYVGIFDTGEGGAVPKSLPGIAEIEGMQIECSRDLLNILLEDRQGLVQHDSTVTIEPTLDRLSKDTGLEGKFLSIDALIEEISSYETYSQLKHSHEQDWSTIDDMILQLSNESVIEDLKSQCTIMIRFADEKKIIYVDRCNLEWLKNALKLGTVIAGAPRILSLHANLSWLGWYEYNCDEQFPYPYQRTCSIGEPLLFADLPTKITDRIRVTRLQNIQFSNTESIQPIEHLPCHTWGNSEYWIDTNGVEHDRFPEYPIDRAT